MKTDRLICCDWGTSNFRLYLIDTRSGKILHIVRSNIGVSDIYKAYTVQTEISQTDFFIRFLNDQIEILSKEFGEDLNGLPVIASGMASSTIGLTNVDYTALPFRLIDPHLNYFKIDASSIFSHNIYVFGGLKSNDDIMRGEEVQIIGLSESIGEGSCICILPGTHSKHVKIEKGCVFHFETFMTGELFHILTEHSILKQSIVRASEMSEAEQKAFIDGVEKGVSINLLTALFNIRTRNILDAVPMRQNYFHLSGILIGFELKELLDSNVELILCGGDNLAVYYKLALNKLVGEKKYTFIATNQMKESVPRAHMYLYKNLKS